MWLGNYCCLLRTINGHVKLTGETDTLSQRHIPNTNYKIPKNKKKNVPIIKKKSCVRFNGLVIWPRGQWRYT